MLGTVTVQRTIHSYPLFCIECGTAKLVVYMDGSKSFSFANPFFSPAWKLPVVKKGSTTDYHDDVIECKLDAKVLSNLMKGVAGNGATEPPPDLVPDAVSVALRYVGLANTAEMKDLLKGGECDHLQLTRPPMMDETPPKRKRGEAIPEEIWNLFGGAAALADVQRRRSSDSDSAAPAAAAADKQQSSASKKARTVAWAHLHR
jgi:hypothetical protein